MTSNWTSSDDPIDTGPRVAFLTTLFSISLLANLAVLFIIFYKRNLRRAVLYILVVNLTACNIFECAANMLSNIGMTLAEDVEYNQTGCSFNAFTMFLVCTESILGLAALSVDRVVALRNPEGYNTLTSHKKYFIVVAFTWIQSIFFGLPLLISVNTASVPYLYMCSVTDSSALIYVSFTALFCQLAPILLIVASFVFIIKRSIKEKYTIRAASTQTNYVETPQTKPLVHQEIELSKFVGTLFVIWLFLVFPHVISHNISHFQYTDEIESSSVVGEVTYPWIVDLLLLWLRFLNTLVLPISLPLWRKDFQDTFKDFVCCTRMSAECNSAVKKTEQRKQATKTKTQMKTQKGDKGKEAPTSFKVPVLFATDKALHIQTIHNTHAHQKEHNDLEIFHADMTTPDQLEYGYLVGQKCDVLGSQISFSKPDTSDYDSDEDVDPLSVSHPITSKNAVDPSLLTRRSFSQPNVLKDEPAPKTNKFSQNSSMSDSGLDMTACSKQSVVDTDSFRRTMGDHNMMRHSIIQTDDISDINRWHQKGPSEITGVQMPHHIVDFTNSTVHATNHEHISGHSGIQQIMNVNTVPPSVQEDKIQRKPPKPERNSEHVSKKHTKSNKATHSKKENRPKKKDDSSSQPERRKRCDSGDDTDMGSRTLLLGSKSKCDEPDLTEHVTREIQQEDQPIGSVYVNPGGPTLKDLMDKVR